MKLVFAYFLTLIGYFGVFFGSFSVLYGAISAFRPQHYDPYTGAGAHSLEYSAMQLIVGGAGVIAAGLILSYVGAKASNTKMGQNLINWLF